MQAAIDIIAVAVVPDNIQEKYLFYYKNLSLKRDGIINVVELKVNGTGKK